MIEWHVDKDYADSEESSCFASIDRTFALVGEQITSDKISEVIRISLGSTRYYVKRYRARGLALRNLIANSRAECEWKNLRRFAAWGLPTASVVACGQERRLGAFVRGAIVTKEITDTLDLRQFAQQHPELLRDRNRFRTIGQQVARIVRTLHSHRFTHNDLFWRNLLIRPRTVEVFLIDCPNGAFWSGPVLNYRIIKDLANLDKLAREYLSGSQRLRFYLDYAGKSRLDDEGKRIIRKVLHAYHRRLMRKRIGL